MPCNNNIGRNLLFSRILKAIIIQSLHKLLIQKKNIEKETQQVINSIYCGSIMYKIE